MPRQRSAHGTPDLNLVLLSLGERDRSPLAAYLLHREFYADQAKQLWCGAAACSGLVRPPDDVFGVLLAVAAIALFAALFVVPHRGSLRIARIVILAGLVAASWGAEALLFAPFFWH